MRYHSAPCVICGQGVIREAFRFQPDVRVVCDPHCQAILAEADSGKRIDLVKRLCLRCGETFMADAAHIGTAHGRGGADLCPACWRDRILSQDADGPYLDTLASLFAAVQRVLEAARVALWRPKLPCPRCGERHRRTYEWSCRYPLGVGLCEGLDGPHVHSICYRCGYETVRAQTKTPPAGGPARGAGLGQDGAMMPVTASSANRAMSPDSTTSRR